MRKDLSNRVHLIDEVRGLSILLMIVYHTFFDIVCIFNVKIAAFYSPFVEFLAVFFAGLFIFISGTACHYSRNNLKRGAFCFGAGMVITIVTYFFMRDELVQFGILHFLGICMMLFPLFKKLFYKIPSYIGAFLCIFLFLLTYNVPNGFLGFSGIFSIQLPSAFYNTPFLFPLGFPYPDFFSTDYFSIFPWIFVFAAGGFFGVSVKEKKLPAFAYKMHIPPLAFIGRHTLIIYLLHQPVVYGILYVIFSLIRG